MGDCQRVLGIDLGIASCGWGVIEVRDKAGSIFAKGGKPAVGVRCFDAPLVYKTGEPKAAQRRSARGQRRVICRRRQRMTPFAICCTETVFCRMERMTPWRLLFGVFRARVTSRKSRPGRRAPLRTTVC